MALPYFPFYPGDYLRDTMTLSNSQHGVYLKLLIYYYTTGCAPICEPDAVRIAGAFDEQSRDDVRLVVTRYFPDGHNSKADKIFAQQEEKCAKKSAMGKKAAESRWSGMRTAMQTQCEPQCAPYANQNYNHNQKEIDIAPTPPSPKKRVTAYTPSDEATRLVIAWERNAGYRAKDRTRAHENIDKLMKKTGLTFEDLGQAMVRYFTDCDEKGTDPKFYYALTNFYGQKGYYRDYIEQP